MEEEGAGVSSAAEVVGTFDFLPLAFLGPLNVTIGSSRFQPFFLIYAKLMAWLKFSKDLESDWIPLALLSYPNFVRGPLLDGIQPLLDRLEVLGTHCCTIREVP